MQDPLARLGLKHPLIVASMAGGPSSPELVIASSAAGALGSIGAAYSSPAAITEFVDKVRAGTDRPFAINLFIQHPQPQIDAATVERAVAATAKHRAELDLPAPQFAAPYEEDFDQQFEAVLKAKPAVLSFVFGVLPAEYMRTARKSGMLIIGTATTRRKQRRSKKAASMRSRSRALRLAGTAAYLIPRPRTVKSAFGIC